MLLSDKSKECMLCHYWYFLDKNFSLTFDSTDVDDIKGIHKYLMKNNGIM